MIIDIALGIILAFVIMAIAGGVIFVGLAIFTHPILRQLAIAWIIGPICMVGLVALFIFLFRNQDWIQDKLLKLLNN